MPSDLKTAYVLHSPELIRYVRRRTGDRHSAHDVVHDAFLRMAEQPIAKVQDSRSYLYQIARNLLLDRKKQADRRRTVTLPHEDLAHIVDDKPLPEEIVDLRLRLERLHRAIRELPFKTQQIFVLHRIDGLTYAAIARHLDISESSVQKHLAMAVQHIARHSKFR